MIDVHAHILPGVDDGARDMENSLKIARQAEQAGVSTIVATPHLMEGVYQSDPEELQRVATQLQEEIDAAGIEIEILLGCELMLTHGTLRLLREEQVLSINDSRYVLVEFPQMRIPEDAGELLYSVQMMGYTPILAHPERYTEIQRDPNLLYPWVKEGVIAQLNAGSLLGVFGSRVAETAEILLEHNLVQLVASDVHYDYQRRGSLNQVLDKLKSTQKEEFVATVEKIINDQEIKVKNPVEYQRESKNKGFFNFLTGLLK